MNKILSTPITNKTINVSDGDEQDVYIMALESSCDETACAIVKNGREVSRVQFFAPNKNKFKRD